MKNNRGPRGLQGKQGRPGISYINAKTFRDFCSNQDKFINILNHEMSEMKIDLSAIKVDVSWTKKILWAILSVVIISFIGILTKSIIGI